MSIDSFHIDAQRIENETRREKKTIDILNNRLFNSRLNLFCNFMSTKRRLSPSPARQQTTTIDQSPTTNVCLVCGDQARFINYGALSCQPCKTFFRRNGFRPEVCVELVNKSFDLILFCK